MTDVLPCPICGNLPEIDNGLSDAPFDRPFVSCPTIHIDGDETFGCPVHADGVRAWNFLAIRNKEDQA